MKICFLENTKFEYNSCDIGDFKLRGAEKVLINLSNSLSNIGHQITILNNCYKNEFINDIKWININNYDQNETFDIAISNGDIRLFDKINCKTKILISHSIQTLEKFIRKKQLIAYLKHKPKIVLLSEYHLKNRPFFLRLFGNIRVDWSVDNIFIKTNINNFNSENRAIFTSRIDRNLDLLIKIWIEKINPNIKDEFFNINLSLNDYTNEIVRSYEEISKKKFIINSERYKNPIKTNKSIEIMYGLRNFIGNANKFSKEKIKIILISNEKSTIVIIRDDGPGFPKDLIDKHMLGEPYIRSVEEADISKYGLGLGTFIAKTLLEKNFANIIFKNSKVTGGAEVVIKWDNNDLIRI